MDWSHSRIVSCCRNVWSSVRWCICSDMFSLLMLGSGLGCLEDPISISIARNWTSHLTSPTVLQSHQKCMKAMKLIVCLGT